MAIVRVEFITTLQLSRRSLESGRAEYQPDTGSLEDMRFFVLAVCQLFEVLRADI